MEDLLISRTPRYTWGDFTGLRYLNQGGSARISLGTLDDFGKIVLKQFLTTKNGVNDHRKEIEILIKHKHPNIVQLYGTLWDGTDRSMYLGYVMEYVDGGDLHNVIYSRRPYDLSQIYTWISQISRGLQFLHKCKIVHRDVKPKKILISTGNQLKLAGFRVSKGLTDTTTAGAGTLSYMAPEVLTYGKCYLSSDIYSLSITIWEIYHRKCPYDKLNNIATIIKMTRILDGARPSIDLEKMDQEMVELIQRCWQKIPENRPTIQEIFEYFQHKVDSAAADYSGRLYDCNVEHDQELSIDSYMSTIDYSIDKVVQGEGARINDPLPDIIFSGMKTGSSNRHTAPETRYYIVEDIQDLKQINYGGEGIISTGRLGDLGIIAVKLFKNKSYYGEKKDKNEIEILVKRRHPNIVNLYGIVWDGIDNMQYLGYIMEYVPGGSLSKVIYDKESSYDMLQICLWIEQIARGLQFLHDSRVIHHDIKPDNILVAADQLKLADFGLAKSLDATSITGGGTYRYMAPEIVNTGKGTLKSDIYSLAMTMWELCHKKRPFSEFDGALGVAHLNLIIGGARPTFEADTCDDDMTTLIQSCWQGSPSERPTAKELAEKIGKKVDLLIERQNEAKTIMIIAARKNTAKRYGDIALLSTDRSQWIKSELKVPLEPGCCFSVYLNGEIYIFGAHDKPEAFFKLDTNLNWKPLAKMNVRRRYISNSSLVWNGRIWVFGGEDANYKRLKSVERYDPKENKWTLMPEMKFPRSHAAVVLWNDGIIISGGYTENGQITDTVEYFTTENGWISLSKMPGPLSHHSLVPYQKKLILLSGDDGEKIQNKVWEVELNTDWKALSSMKNPCYSGAAFVLDMEIYAICGCGEEDSRPIEIFDGDRWRNGPSHSWHYISAVVIPQQLADRISTYKSFKGTVKGIWTRWRQDGGNKIQGFFKKS